MTGRRTGSTVGVVEVVDKGADDFDWGKYLHVKIEIDLVKPLAQRRMLKV